MEPQNFLSHCWVRTKEDVIITHSYIYIYNAVILQGCDLSMRFLTLYVYFSDTTQVSEERVVVGSDSGKVLLFENGELKSEFSASSTAGSTADGSSIRYIILSSVKKIKVFKFLT